MALVAAGAAIFGALAGSYASYLGNKEIEQSKTRAAATGAARVLYTRFSVASMGLEALIADGRLSKRDEDSLVVMLPIEDEKLIASNLTGRQWERVGVALLALRTVLGKTNRVRLVGAQRLPTPVHGISRDFVRETEQIVDGAQEALAPLARG